MALQRVTRAVDRTLDDYVKLKQLGAHWALAEKVAVCVSANPAARDLIARGARLAQAIDGELFVLHLDSESDSSTDAALKLFEELAPDLIITDPSMPDMDGVELTKAIRRLGSTPIIVLSVREQDATKILALDSGADDYVTKPFGTPELLARVRVQLRRRTDEDAPPTNVVEGDFSVDIDAHRVLVRGDEVHLTPKEFDLLLLFTRNAGRVLTHKNLLRSIWGPSGTNQPEYLRVLVAQLRKKIDQEDMPSYIESEPWIGYRFRATE